MASASPITTPCVTCEKKAAGVFKCEGCSQAFCRQHVIEHRDALTEQLDEMMTDHNLLQQTILDETDDTQSPFLTHIDAWEKNSILKIQKIAEEKRDQLRSIHKCRKEGVSHELQHLRKCLQEARANDQFVEGDLRRWSTLLDQLKQTVMNSPSSILIEEDQTKILVGELSVSQTVACIEEDERFGEYSGSARITDNGHAISQCGATRGYTFVRGNSEYSSGQHKIRFAVGKHKARWTMFFSIYPRSSRMPQDHPDLRDAAYGWYSDDSMIYDGKHLRAEEGFRDLNGETRFEVTLVLDCDHGRIEYMNEGSRQHRQMKVDLQRCPYPWQLLFFLYDTEERIEIVSSQRVLATNLFYNRE